MDDSRLTTIFYLLAMFSLPTTAQVSSENYVQTTERISDTQMLSATQYYDGLGRPTAKVAQGVTPQKENLVILQEYDGLGRENKTWLPVTSSSAYLNASDVASQSLRQYGDSRGYKTFVYEGSPLNRVSRLEGEGEAWSGHPVKTEYLVNASSSPLNCKYYRVSMQGVLQDKGYYPEGRLYVTKTTDEDGQVQYEFKNIAGNVILRRTMTGSNESADTYYIYDYRGNLRKQGLWKFYVYDKLGRLVVTGTTASVSDVSESYTYAQYTGSGSLDGYALYGANTPEKALYNGNIAAMSWQVASRALQGYQLEYNNQSMLTDAKYGEGQSLENNKERYNEHLSYDKMGNIQSLLRYGLRDDSKYGLIDNLDYTYKGNQLTKVDDAVKGPYYAGAFHFVDGARASVEYTYDANGNMVKDLNKGISTIQYDIDNRLRTISYSDGRKASYVYDAEGRKHSVSYNLTAMTSSQPQLSVMQSQDAVFANATNGQKTINYCGYIIYDGNETMVLNTVGYSLYDKSGNLSFHYYLKDHLGDNRVVMSEGGTVEQVNDYYPTGALMGSSIGGDKQRYKYNGKELDRLNGLDWYDYGARFYDAETVRWWVGDENSNEYSSISPYIYCSNNPISIIDPDGRKLVLVGSYAQRMSFLQVLQKLTNDNLMMNRATGVVYRSGKPRWSNRHQKLSVGTSLVRDIIANKHTLKIQMSGDENQEDATNKADGRTKGKGSDAIVSFNDRGTAIGVADKKGNASPGNNVAYSALGHELIHGLRDMEGMASKEGKIIYTFKNWQGRFVEREDYPEELITTGLPYKESYKYTENKIRKEHGLPVRVYH